jgi:hypothetical protein
LCTVITTVQDLISNIYPNIALIRDKFIEWLYERAMLTPKNDQPVAINDTLLMFFDGEEKVYTSIDTVVNIDDAVNYMVEFGNLFKSPGMPYYKLILRVHTYYVIAKFEIT